MASRGGTQNAAARQRAMRRFAMVLASALVSWVAVELVGPVRMVDNAATDLLGIVARKPGAVSEDVVVIAIDETTLAGLAYRSPVDRAFLSDLIEGIAAARPAAIGIDIILDTPTEPEKDARLRSLILSQDDPPIVVAYGGERDGLTADQAAFLQRFTSGMHRGRATLLRDPDDGIVRVHDGPADDGSSTSLARAVLTAAPTSFDLGGTLIAYRRTVDAGATPFPVYPAHLAPHLPPAWLEGRYVLVGGILSTADRFQTPLGLVDGASGGTASGVMIHAHILQQLIDGIRLSLPGRAAHGLAVLAAAMVALAAIVVPQRLWLRAIAVASAGPALIGVFVGFTAAWDIVVPPIGPLLAFGGVVMGEAAFDLIAEKRQRRRIRAAFGRYVSPAVVDRLLDIGDVLHLPAERYRITCLCTDVSGFTALCTRLEPERLRAVLNAYLGGITDICFRHGATVDKFVGDAVVAFVGAPIATPDHPRIAIDLAIEIDSFAEDFRRRLRDMEGINFGLTRIGIHTGSAIVGNLGNDRFVDYTAIGDTVNVASRIEAANKQLGTRILASDDTIQASGHAAARPVGPMALAGRSEAVSLWQVASDATAQCEDWRAFRSAATLAASDPAAALAAFETLSRSGSRRDEIAERWIATLRARIQCDRETIDGS